MSTNTVLEVDRARCGGTRLVESELEPLGPAQLGDELGDGEDRHALLRGLFITSYLADSFFADVVASLPRIDAVSVDISGDGPVLAAVHERLGDHLKFSMIISRSHHDSPLAQVGARPTPELFVAGSRRWLTVQSASGPAAAASTWSEVFDGQVPPSMGRIVSLHD